MRLILNLLGLLFGLVLVALIGAGIYVYMNGQSLIRDGVREHGPKVTGTSIEVSNVRFSPWDGEGGLSGFVIGTPSGYSAPYSMRLDDVDLALEPRSIFSDTLVIHSLRISKPSIVYEPGRGGSNLDALQKNINAFTASLGPASDEGAAQNVTIGELVIEGAELRLMAEQLGLGEQAIELADIRLTDIGVEEGGVPPSDVARLAMDALMPQIGKALASEQGKKLLQQVLGDKVDLDQSLKEQAKEAVEGKVKDRLKGLLGDKNE